METNNRNVQTAEEELQRLAQKANDAEANLERVEGELQTVLDETSRREDEAQKELVPHQTPH